MLLDSTRARPRRCSHRVLRPMLPLERMPARIPPTDPSPPRDRNLPTFTPSRCMQMDRPDSSDPVRSRPLTRPSCALLMLGRPSTMLGRHPVHLQPPSGPSRPGAGGGASRQRRARSRARPEVGLGALGRLAAREEDAGELGDGQLRVVAGVLGVVACSNVHHRNLCAGGALSVRGASAGARAGQGRACGHTWYSTKVPPHLR